MADLFDHEPNAATTGALRSARRLLTKKGRDLSGRFLAEGRQAVREALAAPGVVEAVFVASPGDHQDLLAGHSALVRVTTFEQLRRISETVTPQGIVAVCSQPEALLEETSPGRLVVICEQVRDPGNAGTVIRCADAFGADAVVLTKGSVDPFNPKTVRASVGSIFHLPIIRDVALTDAIDWVRAAGLQVFAADGGGRTLLELGERISRPTAWLMGNEAWGLPDDVSALADLSVGVPMWGQAESLNLSTAAAVCLYTTAAAQRGN